MKLLVMYQARDAIKDQPGYHDGFCRLVAEDLLEAHRAIPYFGVSETQGWDGLWQDAYETARDMEADAIFLQFFHGGSTPDPSSGIQRLKGLPSKPTVFTSLGDPFGRVTKRVPKCFRAASALSDVSFLTGMGYLARQLMASGSKNLVLMPNGCCQVRFSSRQPVVLNRPEFDLAFVGSRIRSRNPLSHFYWVSRKRVEFVEAAAKRYGRRFALFGKGWEGNQSWQGPIAYAAQHEAYGRSAVALGGMPNAHHDYYTSDRVFNAVASGVPFVDHWVPGVDRILEPGRDWWLAQNQKETFRLCDKLMEMPSSDRVRLGQEARDRILAHHTQYHRCAEMIEIVSSLREARLSGRRATEPKLTFLSNSCGAGPAPDSVVGWQG
jgi:hypothetical protein